MRRLRILLMISLVLTVGMVALSSSPTAERQFATLQNQDLSAQSVQSLMQGYDNLNASIAREAQAARKAMMEARSSGDSNAYLEARAKLNTLSSYRMDSKTSDYILAQLLELPKEKQDEMAKWLYDNSSYYRPTLTLDFSSEGPNYHYRYRQQIQRQPGSRITLPDASQIRLNSAHLGVLAGWGLTPDEMTHQTGQTIEMSYTSQTFYAIYEPGVRFFDAKSNINLFFDLDNVEVPMPDSYDGSAVFAGWYDRTTGNLITDPASFTVEGKGAFFEALWKQIEIEQIATLYYNQKNLPTNTQLAIGFSFRNTGNVDLSSLKATLSSDSPYVRFLVHELDLGRLASGYRTTNNSRLVSRTLQSVRGERNTFRFVVSSEAPSGMTIPFTLSITNDKGDSWAQDFECVIR